VLPGAWSALCSGMESALSLFLLVATWAAWLALAGSSRLSEPRGWLLLGALGTATGFARLEGFVVVPALAILGAATLRRRPACAAALVAPAALALPVYLIWNRTAFGVWLPVSGMVKSEWAASTPLARWVPESLSSDLAGSFQAPGDSR